MSPDDTRPPQPAPGERPGEPDSIDVAALLAWLEALAADHTRLVDLDEDQYRRLREAAGRIAFPDRVQRRKLMRRRRRDERVRARAEDSAALARTSNRAKRRELRFPVAPVELPLSDATRQRMAERDAIERSDARLPDRERLHEPRDCYICKRPYHELHHHYDHLCPECAELNWRKRTQTADLSGRVAMVTGARVKIGYETALLLLRAGATVVATTRFPCDSARRFAAETDFADWRDRLAIHGLDLRHTPSVERLAAHLTSSLDRLDVLVHNACQTVRRPPAYYEHLIDAERPEDLPPAARALIADHERLIAALVSGDSDGDRGDPESRRDALAARGTPEYRGVADAAGMTQLDLLGERDLAHLFPDGIYDGDGQQLDLRRVNSWRMELADVPTAELIEVQLVNSIAPFVLTARLKPLMLRVATPDKHVVNVSAMEGQFYRSMKTSRHPHTNMAKAALNMMTRTSAADFVRDGIHMNSVDTGWVTDEDPFDKSLDKEVTQRFTPPLDSVDGAARVLDPVFTGYNTGVHCWGQFLKDYRPTRW